MPNRYVREGIITSEAVCSLSWPAEVFYRRLLNKVDDFGRYTAHPALLRAALYPLQLEKVREADMPRHLAECETAGLMSVYRVESKQYLALHKWERGRATASHYPEPPKPLADTGEPLASGGKFSGTTGGLGDVGALAPKLGASAPENPPIPTPVPTTTPIPTVSPSAPPPPAPKRAATDTDEQWLQGVEAMDCYKPIEVRKELGKAQAWCGANNRKCTRRFFVNWLNRAMESVRVVSAEAVPAGKRPLVYQGESPI